MAVACSISPLDVLELDAPTFDALELELSKRWPVELEIAASTLETMHAQLLAFMAAHSKRGTKLPASLRIPRPGDDAASSSTPTRLTPSAFAALLTGRTGPG